MLGPRALTTYSLLIERLTGKDQIPAAQTALVERTITRMSEWVQTYCHRTFGVGTYTEYHVGRGQQKLMMNQAPILSVASISLETAPYTYGYLIPASDYLVQPDLTEGMPEDVQFIYRERGYFAGLLERAGLVTMEPHEFAVRRNVQVIYTAGYLLPRDFNVQATASNSGGTMATGAPCYLITGVQNGTEAIISSEVQASVTGATGSVALTWNTLADSYRIYRGNYPGGENVYFTSSTPSFTDTGAAGTAGTPPPRLPDDLEGAVCEMVALSYLQREKVGKAAEVYEGMSTRYDWMPKHLYTILDGYRHLYTGSTIAP